MRGAQAVRIVGVGGRRAVAVQRSELPPILPSEGIAAPGERVADCVVRDCLAVVGGELILPVRIRVAVGDSASGGNAAKAPPGERIGCDGEDVPSRVISIHLCAVSEQVIRADELV